MAYLIMDVRSFVFKRSLMHRMASVMRAFGEAGILFQKFLPAEK
jgi:hypothetical protein